MKLSLAIVFATIACRVPDPPPIVEAWEDRFERGDVGANYFATGSGYKIENGALKAHGAHNHPLWLRKKLPGNCEISFDAWTTSADIKVEVFGDGVSYDKDGGSYLATSYVLTFGGWNNSQSFVARLDEHGKDMVVERGKKVKAGKRYKFRITRRGTTLQWFIDNESSPFLQYEDKRPLRGAGHEYFGFNNWESETWFDNLRIAPI